MANPTQPFRRRPHLVATRMNDRERALVEAVARAEGEAVSDLLRGILVPALHKRLRQAQRERVRT